MKNSIMFFVFLSIVSINAMNEDNQPLSNRLRGCDGTVDITDPNCNGESCCDCSCILWGLGTSLNAGEKVLAVLHGGHNVSKFIIASVVPAIPADDKKEN